MKRTFAEIFWHSAKQTPRLYFAPLVGAVRGAIEYTRLQHKLAEEEDAIFFGWNNDEPAPQQQVIEQAG